jgi:PPP family 3-phenylpropionic acid transporter
MRDGREAVSQPCINTWKLFATINPGGGVILSFVFFAMFAAIGAMSPFLALYYHQLGLSGTQISLLFAVTPVLLLISQPIFGVMTDRSGHRGRMLSRLALVAAFTGGLMVLGTNLWTMLPLVMLWSFTAGAVPPIADSIALGESYRTGVSYPALRLWGSVGFLIVTALVGRIYTRIGLPWMFAAYALFMIVTWAFARRLPADGNSPHRKPLWPQLRRLLANRTLLLFLLFSGMLFTTQAAHSTFYTLRVLDVGGSAAMLGYTGGVAALTEVPVWLYLGRVASRVGPLPLLAFASLAYAIRWYLIGLATAPSVLLALQLLQAFSFAVFLPTAVTFVGELTPPDLRTSGQALLAMVNAGVATVVGLLIAGRLVDQIGSAGLYRVMAYVAASAGVGFLSLTLVSRRRLKRGVVLGG